MKQQTLAVAADQNAGFEQFRKPTRRDEFLQTMDAIIPWAELCAVIEPLYPKGVGGRPPIGLRRMLRIHLRISANVTDDFGNLTVTTTSDSCRLRAREHNKSAVQRTHYLASARSALARSFPRSLTRQREAIWL